MPTARMRVGISSESMSQTTTPGPTAKDAMKRPSRVVTSHPVIADGVGPKRALWMMSGLPRDGSDERVTVGSGSLLRRVRMCSPDAEEYRIVRTLEGFLLCSRRSICMGEIRSEFWRTRLWTIGVTSRSVDSK